MEVGVAQILGIIGAVASILCTVIVGAVSFFLKKTLTGLEEADKKNAEQISKAEERSIAQICKLEEKHAAQICKVEEKLNDLKADLPLLYVTREDYIHVMNRVEDKLDQILYGGGASKGKESCK